MKYAHKVKPIPVCRDVPTMPAPAALGRPRAVLWADVYADVRAIGHAKVPTTDGMDRTLMFHATNQSWPAGGGRAIVVTGCCIEGGREVWTLAQLADELDLHITGLGATERIARRVWSHDLRADPAPWPDAIAMLLVFK